MSSYRRNFSKLLADHKDAPYDPDHREFVENIASALYERYEDLPPILEWPKAVRYFYACYDLNFQVGNGGFAQAAYNVPELFPIAAEAFDYFGHHEAAQLCRTAISMLPSELANTSTRDSPRRLTFKMYSIISLVVRCRHWTSKRLTTSGLTPGSSSSSKKTARISCLSTQ